MTSSSGSGRNSEIKKYRIIIAASGFVEDFSFGRLYYWFTENFASEVAVVIPDECVELITKYLPSSANLFVHSQDWSSWRKIGDDVLHIRLVKWADFMIVAPLSADTLAKIGNGLCDNLLTCIVRAWDLRKKIYVAPAMTISMWKNPTTTAQIDMIKSIGFDVIIPEPEEDTDHSLVEGDVGVAEPEDIYERVIATIHALN